MLNESKYEKDANGNIIMTIHTSSFYGYQTNKTIQFDDGSIAPAEYTRFKYI